MGKNKKLKQVFRQASQSDSEENVGCQAPVEFLTSDDFHIIQNKRYSKRSPEDDFTTFPRSRHNSCRLSSCSEAEETIGCYSSFWNNSNHETVNANGYMSTGSMDASPLSEHELSASPDSKFISPKSICEGVINGDVPDIKCCTASTKTEVKTQISSCFIESTGEISQSPVLSNEADDKNDEVKIGQSTAVDACDESNVIKAKSLKKKRKPKCKKSGTCVSCVANDESCPNSADSSPTECPSISLAGVSSDEAPDKDKEQHDRKKPSKKTLCAIQEAVKKAKEAEEKLKREEEMRKKLAEEAEKQKLELMKLEQEKKEKKKLKEKLRKEKLKAEGRLLSKSQKQARARMLATLEIYRQQGVDIPQIGDKTHTRSMNDKSMRRRRLDSSQSDRSEASKSERHKTESFSSQDSKESFSDLPSSLDSKESAELLSVGSLTTESDLGHYSCSEESDVLDEDRHLSLPNLKLLGSESKAPIETANHKSVEGEKTKYSEVVEDKVIDKLRSPVVCVLGHVDTGKTKLLDFIRKTHIQDSEAGGITQQIGATMIPQSALKEKCKMVKNFTSIKIEVPGLLVIDTPGHESFRNLRSRGTSLCDIAILVVDIMHGLQAQSLESIELLRENKIPFVVALNKVDRIYGWKSIKDVDIVELINSQSDSTLWEFKKRCQDIILQFANQRLNAALFHENKDPRSFVSMVPTSAISGDGMGNILSLITQLTQTLMHKHLKFSDELKATVMEVKVIPGLGTTIDVILVNGQLHEGDTIVLAGQEGPIVTQIRSLLMPQPLRELRVKNPYIDYKSVEGAQGVKITGKDFDKTLAGMPLFVAESSSKIETLKSKVSRLCQFVNNIKTSERGVYVLASTLGSLEALLGYLASSGIPFFGVKVGPVVKKDVMKASIMLEHDPQYATILAFDVKIDKDAQELADHLGVKILHADIIYHLFDMFMEHKESYLKKLEEKRHLAIFPCILTVLAVSSNECGSPITLHVTVEAGTLKEGTPLCMPKRGNLDTGNVTAIQVDGVSVTSAKEGQSAILTIENNRQEPLELEPDDNLVSRISRQSIEVLKEYYRDELSASDWHLMSELKKVLHTA